MADGLFNYQDPRVLQEQYLAQQRQNATAAAQMPLLQQVVASGGNLGATLGTGLGRLFGGQTAAEVENEAIKGIFAGAAQQTTDPVERMKIAAAEFRKRGMEGRAIALEQEAAKLGLTQTQTRASEAKMMQEQQGFQFRFEALKKRFPNISDEEARAVANSETAFNNVFKDQQAKLSSFAQQLVDEGLQPGTPQFQARMRQYNERQTSKKSLEETLGTGLAGLAAAMAGPRAEKAAGAEGTEVGKATAQIQGKFDALTSLRTAESLLKDAQGNYKIYAGLFGPEETIVAKATKGLLGDRDKAINTEQFMAEISTTVIPLLQEFGGNDSNEELRFLQRVVGGDQRLEPEAIERIIKSAQRKIERGIKRVQQQQQATQAGQPLPTQPIEATSNAVDFSTLKRK